MRNWAYTTWQRAHGEWDCTSGLQLSAAQATAKLKAMTDKYGHPTVGIGTQGSDTVEFTWQGTSEMHKLTQDPCQ